MSTLTVPPKFMKRLQTIVEKSTKDMLDKIDILGTSDGPSFTKAPVLTPHQKEAMDALDSIGRVLSVLSYPRFAARNGLPAVPARATITGDSGAIVLPADVWNSLVKDGWVDSCGRVTPQYVNAISG